MIQNSKKMIACALLAMLLPGQTQASDTSNAKLWLGGEIAVVAASPFIWRACTKHQDEKVLSTINNVRSSTVIPNVRKDLDLNSHSEANIKLVLQKLHPTSEETATARAIYACKPREVITTDTTAIKNCLTYDLWGRSWCNPTLATKRDELKHDTIAIREVECFTNQHASFLHGHQLLHETKTSFNIESPVTAQKINALPSVAQQTRKVLGFKQLTEAQMAKLHPFTTTQTSKAYPNLSKQATRSNALLAHLHSQTQELSEYNTQLAALLTDYTVIHNCSEEEARKKIMHVEDDRKLAILTAYNTWNTLNK